MKWRSVHSPIVFVLIIVLVCSGKCNGKGLETNPLPCSERIALLDPELSDYILPFQVGRSYILSQSYCNPYGGHSNQLAYDFAMRIGDTMGFPHLHFGVYQFWPPTETYDVPVAFRNARGPLTESGILIADSLYTALEY